MVSNDDLRRLSDMCLSERAFLSVYLADPRSVKGLDPRLKELERSLKAEGLLDVERGYLKENAAMVKVHLEKHPLESGSLCIFACRALDYLEAISLAAPVEDFVRLDSSPFVRPLAEAMDEFENVAVVLADNTRARIFLLRMARVGPEETLEGNIKNHVKKGGWSQQRYERRRDKELLHYAREISDELAALGRAEEFRRIVLVGGEEILRLVEENLPAELADMVAGIKPVSLRKRKDELTQDIWDVFFEEERRAEKQLWERIQGELGRGGRAVAGIEGVLEAARQGRIEKLVVDREFTPEGVRCHACDRLHASVVERCEECGVTDLYPVRVVNELCERVALTGGETEFVDPIPSLTEAGSITALLRW